MHDLHPNGKPANENATEDHLENDSNPIIFKIRNATLSQSSDRNDSSKEEIWFEKPSENPYESDSNEDEGEIRGRENLKRKTTILRKIRRVLF